MKNSISIIGINLLALLLLFVIAGMLDTNENGNLFLYYFPILILGVINIIIGSIYYYKGNKRKAKLFVLACLLIVVIGDSACVSIHFKPRPKKQNRIEPYTDTAKVSMIKQR